MAESGSRLEKGQPIDLIVAAKGCPSVFVGLDSIHDEVVVEHPAFFEVNCHQSCGLFCRWSQSILKGFVHMKRHSANRLPTQEGRPLSPSKAV